MKLEAAQIARYPIDSIGLQLEAAFLSEQEQFPNANRRQPEIIFRISQRSGYAKRQALWLQNAPNPDVRIEK